MKTNILKNLILGAGIFSLAATTVFAEETILRDDNNLMPTAGPLTAQQFVIDAVWSGDKEVALSQLAQQKSQNPEVKAFAARMVTDHSRAADKLTAIADNEHLYYPNKNSFSFVNETTTTTGNGSASGLTLPQPGTADLDSPKGIPARAMTQGNWEARTNADITTSRNLNGLSGTAFDRAYVDQMVRDHSMAVQEFERASTSLDDPQLKQCATDLLPTMRDHYRMAQDLQGKLGGPQTAPNNSPRSHGTY